MVLAALALAGCAPMDAAEGKSGFRAEVERRALITLPAEVEPVSEVPVEVAEAAPVVPQPAPAPPECVPVYRVWACVDGARVEL